MCLRDTTTATNKFTVAPRSVATLVPPPGSLQIQILCDQKMRRFLPTQTSPTDQKCNLRMHSKQIRPPLQTLSSAHKAHNVSMPATKDFMAHTTAANLSSTRDRPPVTTAIAASSPDNHHAQAPRHPASKSDALCEILDLLDGPLSFFLTFFSWLIITLVQLPKSCRPSSQFQHQFRSSKRSSTMFKNNLSLLILAQATHHSITTSCTS